MIPKGFNSVTDLIRADPEVIQREQFRDIVGDYKFSGLKEHLIEKKIIVDFDTNGMDDFDIFKNYARNLSRNCVYLNIIPIVRTWFKYLIKFDELSDQFYYNGNKDYYSMITFIIQKRRDFVGLN